MKPILITLTIFGNFAQIDFSQIKKLDEVFPNFTLAQFQEMNIANVIARPKLFKPEDSIDVSIGTNRIDIAQFSAKSLHSAVSKGVSYFEKMKDTFGFVVSRAAVVTTFDIDDTDSKTTGKILEKMNLNKPFSGGKNLNFNLNFPTSLDELGINRVFSLSSYVRRSVSGAQIQEQNALRIQFDVNTNPFVMIIENEKRDLKTIFEGLEKYSDLTELFHAIGVKDEN